LVTKEASKEDASAAEIEEHIKIKTISLNIIIGGVLSLNKAT
jgi:hypothetical protein